MEHEMTKCLGEVMDAQKKLLLAFNCALERGLEQVNTQEAGEIADMIKDFSEAEKNCYKACYYKSIVEAMEDHKNKYGYYPMMSPDWDEPRYGWYPPRPMYNDVGGYNPGVYSGEANGGYVKNGSYGYDGQARDSQGRFVSDGNGRMGFHEGMADYRMPQHGPESEFGRAYDKYREAKRHFTETGSSADRDEMSMHAKEHLNATIMTMGEMYKESDPELKRQIKSNLGKLIGEMV